MQNCDTLSVISVFSDYWTIDHASACSFRCPRVILCVESKVSPNVANTVTVGDHTDVTLNKNSEKARSEVSGVDL